MKLSFCLVYWLWDTSRISQKSFSSVLVFPIWSHWEALCYTCDDGSFFYTNASKLKLQSKEFSWWSWVFWQSLCKLFCRQFLKSCFSFSSAISHPNKFNTVKGLENLKQLCGCLCIEIVVFIAIFRSMLKNNIPSCPPKNTGEAGGLNST